MKKFFLKLFLLFVLCSIPLLYINYNYKRTNYFKNQNNLENFFNVPYDLEMVNLGSSHGYVSILYSTIPEIKGRNFALPAQHFKYDYTILKLYKNHIKRGAIVLLPVSYFSFHYALYTQPSVKTRYYRILPTSSIPDSRISEWLLYSVFPIFSSSCNFLKIFNDDNALNLKYLSQSKKWENSNIDDIKKEADFTYIGWVAMGDVKHDTEIVSENKNILIDMIKLCQKEGFVPVLITTPVTRQLNDRYAAFCANEFYDMIREVQSRSGNTPYLDYSHDARFVDELSLFMDCNHLNQIGGKKFTQIIYEDLKKRSLINK